MSNLFVPVKTADLKWIQDLPFSIQYDDVYHSLASGIEQSRHVFIEGNNLISRWQKLTQSGSDFIIAETGFGTGLNFLLTWLLWEQYAPKNCRLHFISCEKYPLTLDDLKRSLKSWPQLENQAQQLIDHYPVLTPGYHHLSFANGKILLTLMLGDAFECYEQLLICGDAKLELQLRTSFVDAWYLDGFSPSKNKSMWSDSLFKVLALLSKQGTTVATYTSAAIVKEGLSHHGFMVEKKKGFGPKRHMISATLKQNPISNLKKRHTPWHVGNVLPIKNKSAVIVGAGLAGCFTAYSLAKRGWNVTLIDEREMPGQGASANQQAVLFPKLSAYNSPLTQFMLMAFLYAQAFYKQILKKYDIHGELRGALLLACNNKERLSQNSLYDWLGHYPQLGALVDSEKASELSGISLCESGLFIPMSGWINSPCLCQFLANTKGISLVTGTSIDSLYFDGVWHVNDWETKILILANGYKITSFEETDYLPVKPIRGQMTTISENESSALLKVPLCGDGHVLPANQGIHYLGATYELKTASSEIKNEDDLLNLNKLKQLAPEIRWSDKILGHWAGVRATTIDYLPIVGPVAQKSEFLKLYAGLESNSRRWIAESGPYYPGLYVCAGFGSRGVTTVPLSAEWLASLINREMGLLPRNLQQALSPARFLRKDIMRGTFQSLS